MPLDNSARWFFLSSWFVPSSKGTSHDKVDICILHYNGLLVLPARHVSGACSVFIFARNVIVQVISRTFKKQSYWPSKG